MSFFKNRRLDLKIHSSFISFGEMEQNSLLLFILKITIKSSHKRRAQRGAAERRPTTYLQKTFPIKRAPTNPRSAPR
jgi:hypothetical protein